MRIRSFVPHATLALAVVMVSCLPILSGKAFSALAQTKPQPKVSADEDKLAQAINSAPDPAAKLKAAAAFIKKYPKSSLRPNVAAVAADQIAAVTDPAQKLSLAQEYQNSFNAPSDQELIIPVFIDAYADGKRFDEAFATGAEFLKTNPDSVRVLVRLMLVGTEQAKQQNPKFVLQSLGYGAHAIELIEAKKIPAGMDEATWKHYEAILPGLYQSMGILNLVKGDSVEAKARLSKAAELAPSDPFNWFLLVDIFNAEYQEVAKRYQNMPNSPAKNDEYKRVLASLDRVIDSLARVIALSESNAALAPARGQALTDLEAYYKYRHNNSTEGMQQLIDKYKVAAKP